MIDSEHPGSAILALHRATHATLHTLTTRLADLDRQALATMTSAQRAGFDAVIDALTVASR